MTGEPPLPPCMLAQVLPYLAQKCHKAIYCFVEFIFVAYDAQYSLAYWSNFETETTRLSERLGPPGAAAGTEASSFLSEGEEKFYSLTGS